MCLLLCLHRLLIKRLYWQTCLRKVVSLIFFPFTASFKVNGAGSRSRLDMQLRRQEVSMVEWWGGGSQAQRAAYGPCLLEEEKAAGTLNRNAINSPFVGTDETKLMGTLVMMLKPKTPRSGTWAYEG